MNSIFANLPPVVKNLLLLNIIMYVITFLGEMQSIQVTYLLGGYVFNSPFFEPYQIITHFFMHGGLMHIFFNMFALVMFGPILEQVWGPKRFFIFYVATALGAFFLHQLVGYIEVNNIIGQLRAQGLTEMEFFNIQESIINAREKGQMIQFRDPLVQRYNIGISVPVVGASGAIFGILVAFGYLFPNTRLMLLFPPIPIKAKWLVLIMFGYEVVQMFMDRPDDNVAHLAHIGGAIVGFFIVLFWQKSTKRFY
ncbi:MAG: rhomboid family intramembrane serine protease [Brumimicrobium sp.]